MASVHLPPLNLSGSVVQKLEESRRSSHRDAAEVEGVFSEAVGLSAVEFGVGFDFDVTYRYRLIVVVVISAPSFEPTKKWFWFYYDIYGLNKSEVCLDESVFYLVYIPLLFSTRLVSIIR